MNPERLQYLFERYFDKTASEGERAELNEALSNEANKEEVLELFALAWEKYQGDGNIIAAGRSTEILEAILAKDKDEVKQREIIPVRRIPWGRIAAAAIVIIMLGAGSYLYFNQKQPAPGIATAPVIQDVKAPSVSRATITLSNGQKVFLDSAANGQLAQQGNTHITKTANGIVAYSATPEGNTTEIVYNTLSNPRGSQPITLTLSDGTQVWLNAESSLKYPVAFTGNERKVEITGEAYFEVAHNAAKPFFVSKGTISVEVLGTHFNVNAYEDETKLRVTLLEGSVKVLLDATPAGVKRTTIKSVTIKPGEQAVIDGGKEAPGGQGEASNIDVKNNIDLESVMAWKNGFFSLKDQSLEAVMKQLERWYDITVKYEGAPPNIKFQGAMDRGVNLSDFVKYMQDLHIKARIEGKTLIITGK